MNYNNNDDNRIRRKKVSSNDYNYKYKQHQRYYKEKVRIDNTSYERKIENNKIKGYKSTLTTPHPCPISYNKKITGNLKNSIIFFRFPTTFPEYSIILFKTVPETS